MKQPRNVAAQRINPCNVGTFVLVAVQATPSEIVQHRLAAMLLCDDVVDLKRQRVADSRDLAVVAAIASQLANLFQQFAIHECNGFASRDARNDRRAFD